MANKQVKLSYQIEVAANMDEWFEQSVDQIVSTFVEAIEAVWQSPKTQLQITVTKHSPEQPVDEPPHRR